MKRKLPILAAGVGVVVCVVSLGYSLLDYRYHLFPGAAGSISNIIMFLNPALVLQIPFASGPNDPEGRRITYAIWAITGVVNAGLYYLIGLAVAQVVRIVQGGHKSNRESIHPN